MTLVLKLPALDRKEATILQVLEIRPGYESDFQCIGNKCEDTCCQGWSVYVDQPAWERYEALEPGPLRTRIYANVDVLAEDLAGRSALKFVRIRMDSTGHCPMLNDEKLCSIQVEKGEEYLGRTCAVYPRIVHAIDGEKERALSLSCPEAARLVLTSEDLLGKGQPRIAWKTVPDPVDDNLTQWFYPIRAIVLELLGRREYTIWQRMLLIGIFLLRLEEFQNSDTLRLAGFDALAAQFRQAIEGGGLARSMDVIAPNLELQTETVLHLASLDLPRSFAEERFQDLAHQFAAGIGYQEGVSTLTLLAQNYERAYLCYFEPFFSARPHMLENLLVNTVFRTLFPFGHSDGQLHHKPDLQKEFALFATQFSLLKGLLIGVAGFKKSEFCESDVVFAVQAACKHFEHHPQFLETAHSALADKHMNNLRGMATLLRN